MLSTHRYGVRNAPSASNHLIIKNPLRGLSPEDIYELNIAKQKIDSVLSKKKSPRYVTIRRNIKAQINEMMLEKIPKKAVDSYRSLTHEQTQILRDEVLEMIKRGSPLYGIQRFLGKTQDGDPVKFFEKQYSRYIRRGHEVIFSPDLLKIDQALLSAMRNTVRSDEMPIGTRVERTNAIADRRFVDSLESQIAAAAALATRKKRARRAKAHEDFA